MKQKRSIIAKAILGNKSKVRGIQPQISSYITELAKAKTWCGHIDH